MVDPLPRGNTENQRAASAAGDRVGASLVQTGRNGVETTTNFVRNAPGAVSNFISGGPAANDDDDDNNPNTPNRRRSFRWGDVIGGVLGVAGAWLVSSFFGGGWLGTIMFALFAIPGFMMGRQGLGNTFSGWMGEPQRPATSPAVGAAPAQAMGQGRGAAAPEATPPALTPPQQLQAEVSEITRKAQTVHGIISAHEARGDLPPRRLAQMQRQIANVDRMLQDMGTLDVERLDPQVLRQITREFGRAESWLDRTMAQDPILAGQIQNGVQPRVAPQEQRQTGRFDQSQVAVGATINLPPQTMEQVRSAAPHQYAYGTATEAPTSAPRFDATTMGQYQYTSQRLN